MDANLYAQPFTHDPNPYDLYIIFDADDFDLDEAQVCLEDTDYIPDEWLS